MKRRVAERAVAVGAIGIGLPPVQAGSSAATQMATDEDRHGRNSICVNRSYGVRRTAEADIREETHPAMADRARHRATRGRVMAEAEGVALGPPLVVAEATSVAAEDMRPAVEAAAIPVVAFTPVAVADIQAITKSADRSLT